MVYITTVDANKLSRAIDNGTQLFKAQFLKYKKENIMWDIC